MVGDLGKKTIKEQLVLMSYCEEEAAKAQEIACNIFNSPSPFGVSFSNLIKEMKFINKYNSAYEACTDLDYYLSVLVRKEFVQVHSQISKTIPRIKYSLTSRGVDSFTQ